jgi:hypothetical protein
MTRRPIGPANTIDLSKNKNRYSDGINEYIEYTPNALTNMTDRIVNFIGVANNNTLPAWMTSPQPDPNTPGQFVPPLGFIRAVVLAYTVPGGSELVAHRLRYSGFLFNRIPFMTDRYQIDNWLSSTYDIAENRFRPGVETTIDLKPSLSQKFRYQGFVDYVVSAGYNDIHGKGVDEVIQNGNLDGSIAILDGETLIFYQQDNFPVGVKDYNDYIERGTPNQRSAVYQIELQNNGQLIQLKLLRYTKPGDIVTVRKGTVYGGENMVFEAYALHGPVPQWWFFEAELSDLIDSEESLEKLLKPHVETTFDKHATKFVSNRDQFADLDTTGKYIKFPKNGVFI